MATPKAYEPSGFTPEQRKQIEAALGKFNPICPVCHSQAWLYYDRVDLPVPTAPGAAFPTLPLICTTCGNTQFINLITLGIITTAQKALPQPGK